MSLTKLMVAVMVALCAAQAAYASDSPRVANAAKGIQPPQAGQWTDAAGRPADAPKPSCGKKPRDGEYVPVFKKEKDGTFSSCVWTYVGPREGYWETVRRCALYQGDYQYCVSLGAGSYSAQQGRNNYFMPYIVPPCRDTGDPGCHVMPPAANPNELRRW